MSGFVDQYLPSAVPGYPCISAPRTKTTIQANASGRERRNQEWEHPLHHYVLPEAIARKWEIVQALLNFWRVMRGPFHSWPWRDPLDFASRDLVRPNVAPAITMTDQVIGTADGFTDSFQLVKTYSVGGETYEREILLPVLDSVQVAIDGVPVADTDYSVTRPGGVVTFDAPPAAGVITAGFLFDVEVRFESDDALEGILRAHRAGGFADISLIEVRSC